MMAVEYLHEFPILIEGTNEVIILFLNKEDIEKATQGKINVLIILCPTET